MLTSLTRGAAAGHRWSDGDEPPTNGVADPEAATTGATIFRAWLLLFMAQGPCHGYEVAEGLRSFGLAVWSTGHVYRTLRKLEQAGVLTSRWEESGVGQKPRRMYELTTEGRAALDDHARALRDLEAQLSRFGAHYRGTEPR